MSIMVKIDGVPLFNSKWKAERWGKKFGLTGTHAHVYKNQVGWMGGKTHEEVSKAFKPREKVFKTVQTRQQTQTQQTQTQVTQTPIFDLGSSITEGQDAGGREGPGY